MTSLPSTVTMRPDVGEEAARHLVVEVAGIGRAEPLLARHQPAREHEEIAHLAPVGLVELQTRMRDIWRSGVPTFIENATRTSATSP